MTNRTLLSIPLPKKSGDNRYIGNLSGSALALSLAEIAARHNGPVLAVVADTQTALKYSLKLLNSVILTSMFFQIGKHCLMIISRLIKILSLNV